MSENTSKTDEQQVTLAHGAGGAAMRTLLSEQVLPRFVENAEATGESKTPSEDDWVGIADLDDGAVLPIDAETALVFTTDTHVVKPIDFPGGDIGRLAVAGTVNDLAMMGATSPAALSCALVLEEGTPLSVVESVLDSMKKTAAEAATPITTGDTKVMEHGDIDGIVVNTAGVAAIDRGQSVSDAGLAPGDAIIVSGPVGDHGIALLAAREGFEFGGELESDVAPVNHLVEAAMAAGEVTAMKDPTRGGLANALNEMADKAEVGIDIEEEAVPLSGATASAGEVLGIDPLSVANEGRVVFAVKADDAEEVLAAIREQAGGEEANIVGEVTDDHLSRVVVDTGFGRRYLTEPEGEALPRIC
ncbi:MAG: hydrogenase expression/formation protein HypE [Halodesulfurarchaeum sp.]